MPFIVPSNLPQRPLTCYKTSIAPAHFRNLSTTLTPSLPQRPRASCRVPHSAPVEPPAPSRAFDFFSWHFLPCWGISSSYWLQTLGCPSSHWPPDIGLFFFSLTFNIGTFLLLLITNAGVVFPLADIRHYPSYWLPTKGLFSCLGIYSSHWLSMGAVLLSSYWCCFFMLFFVSPLGLKEWTEPTGSWIYAVTIKEKEKLKV